MPNWILICANCKAEFQHSQIEDVGMPRLLIIEKPIIPTGERCICPKCEFAGLYRRTDLLYRSA